MLDSVYHLFARHPDLARDQNFLQWLKTNGAAYWFDTAPADGDVTIVVVSKDEACAFAALEQEVEGQPPATKLVPDLKLTQTGIVDLTQIPPAEVVLRVGIAKLGFARRDIVSIRPSLAFKGTILSLDGWDVRVATDCLLQFISAGEDLTLLSETVLPYKAEARRPPLLRPFADDMADNELHSTWMFRQEADSWTQGPLTISEKARNIGAQVYRTYAYDGNINLITPFTWSDVLTRDRNQRRGICDEYAVVQITYLRSIGIPARMKLLVWTAPNGDPVAHACVEFSDNGTWHHLDGLWNAFKNPGIYRQSGGRNVTVMDADYPLDSRSDQPVWGQPDIRGDGILSPYGDFIIIPPYPGNARPGYSR